MDIHNIRLQLRQKTIYEVPLRVTFYARVSTDSQEQLNSLTNQISYYEEMIKKNSAWTYVPGYIDEGLSGISTKKREHFHRMIDDAKAGKFDLILTKEISRFARNTLDSIQYTRDLLNAGVAVFFQNDNIKTIDEDSELRLSIMSSIAQDELRKLSSRVKFGHQQAIKEGVVLGNNRIFGYLKDDGRLVIDESEAPMVRQLFELYATGEYSMKQIEKIFWDQGYRNYRGNKIAHTTMSNMISNPKYKGYYVGNKVKVIDMFTKKQKFLPPEEWVMFKDETGEIVPAIVSEELWDQANAVLRRRSDDVKNRQNVCNSENLLTSKLYCTCCGTPYYRKESKSRKGVVNSKWICSGKIKNGAHTCDSIPLYESELKPILLEVFQDTKVDTEALIAKYSAMHAELTGNAVLQKEIANQKQIIELEQQKKSKLLGYNVSGRISDRDFIAMTDQCNADIQKAEEALRELEEQMQSNEEFQKHMAKLRAVMREAQKCVESGFITKGFVDQYIDKIFVTPEKDGTIRLDIRIFTGEATEKYLQKLKVRAGQMNHLSDRPEESSTTATTFSDGGLPGHMSKKMIEAYEQNMQ